MNFKGFIDTSMRDGQASPLLFDTHKYFFTLEEKKQLVNALLKLGVYQLEFFSPVVSPTEENDFSQLKKYIKSTFPAKKILLISHCRCHKTDIDKAIKAGFNGLNLYMGISDKAQKHSYGKNITELLKLIKKTIIETRKKYPGVYLRYSVEDAFRTPLEEIFKVYDAIYPHVDTLGTPDTTGIATPELVKERIKALKQRYPKVNLECHFHNDRGHSLINSLTAIKAGAEYIDTSIWGIAERSGITSLTGILLNIYFYKKDLVKNYDLELCYPLNVLMGSILKMQVPYTEPVSLTNRTHIAGVHQKAVLNSREVYEGNDLKKFGVSREQLLLGPLSGWNFIYYYLKEVEGYILNKQDAKQIAQDFKKEADKLCRKVKPEELLRKIVEKYSLIKITIPQNYQDKRIENLN